MLLRQTLLYLPAQLIGPIFQFVSIIVWTHFLSPESMGVFALIVATQELAYTLTLFWFTLYTMRYHDVTGPEAERERFLDTESAVLVGAVLASVVLTLALAIVVESAWTVSLILASIAHIVSRAVVVHLSERARAEHDLVTYTVLQTVWPVVGLGLGAALVELVDSNVAMVLWGYTIAQLATIGVALWRLEIGANPLSFDRTLLQRALRYGLPLLGGAFFIWVAINAIRFIVEWREGAAAVGLITVGWMLGFRASMFAAMLVTAAAFPIAVRRSRQEGLDAGQAQLERNGVLLLVALMPAATGLWLVGDPLVKLVVAEAYQAITVAILPLAILAGGFRTFRIHFGEQIFLLREQPMVPLYNDIFDAVAAIAGAGLGLAVGGLPGSIAGSALAALASLAVTLVVGWRMHRYALPVSDVARIAAATAVMAFAVSWVPLGPDVASIALAAGVGIAVYAAALALLYPEGARGALAVLAERRQRRA